jgi:hypothetical protein
MDEPVDDRFTDDRIFKELKSTLGFDLRGNDDRRLMIALFEDIHQGSRFVVGIVSQAEIIEDQDFGLDETAHVVEITSRGLGGQDLFGMRPIDWREKLRIRGRVRSAQPAGRITRDKESIDGKAET